MATIRIYSRLCRRHCYIYMRSRLFRNISANIIQQAVNQLFSLVIFYIMSRQLTKEVFGSFNWSLAFLFTTFNIMSFGLDQMTVKKIAAGQQSAHVVSLHLLHVLLSGTIFYGILLISCSLIKHQPATTILLLLGIGKLLSYFASPFRQAVAGKEAFSTFAWMSVTSNAIKGLALIICSGHQLSINTLVLIFIAGDAMELIVAIILYYKHSKAPLTLHLYKPAYFSLLKEAMPQLGVVIATTLMARFDWLFIGIIATTAQLAEYSFAYKAFELATFPLLVIAPLLIPRFVKYSKEERPMEQGIQAILRSEMSIAAFIILLLNICWAPVMDAITAGKYGAVNNNTIFLLSLSMPFLYANNILWTNIFSRGKLHNIFRIIGFTCIINVAADCLLIPFLGNEGAAIAYLVAQLIQLILYTRENTNISALQTAYIIAGCPLCAIFSLSVVKMLSLPFIPALLTAISLYIVLILLSRLLVKKDVSAAIHLLTPETN